MTTLKKFAGLFVEKWRDPAVCEACGEQFACGASLTGCWCSEVKLTAEARSELRERYTGCLCRNCLQSYSCTGERSSESN